MSASSTEAIKQKLPIVKSIISSYDIPEGSYTFTAFKSSLDEEYSFLIMSNMGDYFTGSIVNDLLQHNVNIKVI